MGLTRILYVEDEADIREIAALALQDVGGFRLEICASGMEAIEKAEAFQPELILLDVMMPGMDGPTTLRRLRENPRLAATPAIFMTAKVQARDITELKQAGALDVIAKPFDPMTLADRVREIWSRARGPRP